MPYLSNTAFRDASPRLPTTAIVALAAVYLLSGIIGRDPWKTVDAIHLGIAHDFAGAGGWLFPHLAGEPWPHDAPLYHWVAALLGRLLGDLLPFHDAARLATPLFAAIFLAGLAGAARAFHGTYAARIAPLLAIGTLGLLLPLHEAQPAVAGIACAALAWWGGGLLLQEQGAARWRGGALLGVGCGLAFLSHGLVGLLMAAAVLPAPTLRRDWPALVLALLVATALAAAWPLAVILHDPQLWQSWWRNELAEMLHSRRPPSAVHAELVAWGYWPILPLALWGLWVERRRIERCLLPLLGALLGLAWFLSGSTRLAALLPAMIPLILLASAGADRLRRGAANAWNWFALTSFTFFGALVWLGASAQGLGWPEKIAANFAKTAPGHAADYAPFALAWAAALSLLWLLSWRLPRAPWRACLHWAAGTTLLWALTATLWMSWLDHPRTYRPVVDALRSALPNNPGCIERSTGVGAAQRAALDYFAGLRTQPPRHATQNCFWRVHVGNPGHQPRDGWVAVWQGSRPGDRRERWYLERRAD